MKYSRQRECIIRYLESTTEHPTADTVYSYVRQEFPRISLGTVYRNLNLLTEVGEIKKITAPDGADRFDADKSRHYHVLCTSCGKVSDMMIDDSKINDFHRLAEENYSGTISAHSILFYGTCRDCEIKKTQTN
ncbi:MAG: transcriptional repressor [Lachnospiraceae bacterium]|nr:transcriptional repressor [Lachnospiraceae bacterium]